MHNEKEKAVSGLFNNLKRVDLGGVFHIQAQFPANVNS